MSTTETLESLGALLGAIRCRPTSRDYGHIPPGVREGLDRYAQEGVPVGDFLKAVISNDFLMAVGRADAMSMAALPAISCYVYQELPSRCHGSAGVYKAWVGYYSAKLAGTPEEVQAAHQIVISSKNLANDWTSR